jgi:hypothetical protein
MPNPSAHPGVNGNEPVARATGSATNRDAPRQGRGKPGISAATSGADFIWNRIRWLAPPANFRDASGVRYRLNQQRTRETRALPPMPKSCVLFGLWNLLERRVCDKGRHCGEIDTAMNLFSELTPSQKKFVFDGLMRLLKSESQAGFNNDKMGMAYVIGAKRGDSDFKEHGDSPDRNGLFQMMAELSEDLRGHPEMSEFVNCWQDFCRIAIEAYRKYHPSKTQ